MKKIVLFLLSAFAISVAGPYPYTHDGFFLNMALGLGYQNFELNHSDEDVDLQELAKGTAFEYDMKIGGRILPFTILHYTSIGIYNFAEFEINQDRHYSRYSYYDDYYDDYFYGDDGYTLCMMLFQGIGATRYFRPYNIFASVSVGATMFFVKSNGYYSSNEGLLGYGFQIAGGKEWWIGENLGIGAQMSLTYGKADYDIVHFRKANSTASAFAINFMATVTFN
jgi:hypothetical protein